MPLIEVLTLEIGSSIAKYILRLWLKDNSTHPNVSNVSDIEASIIDILMPRRSVRLFSRDNQQQFRIISQEAERRIFTLFKKETVSLDEGSRTAVALAVAEAFNSSHLSFQALIKCNLDPSALERHILSSYPNLIREFTEAEYNIYLHVIREICVSIMEQAPKLPAFAENSYAELLGREAQVTDLAIKIIKQLNEKDEDQAISKTKLLQMIDSLLLSQKEKKQLLSVLNIVVEQDTRHTKRYPYDVALSYAGEDRRYANALATVLKSLGVKVFFDQYEKPFLWGKELHEYLTDLYQKKARFCVIFLSQHYATKVWTKHELRAAQARALEESKEYILPVRLDDTPISGILPTVSYLNWYQETAETIAEMIMAKLAEE